jgi:nicotinate-nucleotide adenylyltransferase
MTSPLSGYTLVYGGSFNPPHMGHQLACLYGLEALGAEALWVVPVHEHPFGKELIAFEHRMQMCKLMVESLGPRASVNAIEQELKSPVRTYELFSALKSKYPEKSFAMLMGADLLAERSRWYRFDDLEKLVKIVVVGRGGFDSTPGENVYEVDLPEVSSSDIRARLKAGQSVDGLIPVTIRNYLIKSNLYGSRP